MICARCSVIWLLMLMMKTCCVHTAHTALFIDLRYCETTCRRERERRPTSFQLKDNYINGRRVLCFNWTYLYQGPFIKRKTIFVNYGVINTFKFFIHLVYGKGLWVLPLRYISSTDYVWLFYFMSMRWGNKCYKLIMQI